MTVLGSINKKSSISSVTGANASTATEADDPNRLPFPEWSDQDVNNEKWDLGKQKVPKLLFVFLCYSGQIKYLVHMMASVQFCDK